MEDKKITGKLDVWSLLKNFNLEHPDFGKVAAFLKPPAKGWIVEITPDPEDL